MGKYGWIELLIQICDYTEFQISSEKSWRTFWSTWQGTLILVAWHLPTALNWSVEPSKASSLAKPSSRRTSTWTSSKTALTTAWMSHSPGCLGSCFQEWLGFWQGPTCQESSRTLAKPFPKDHCQVWSPARLYSVSFSHSWFIKKCVFSAIAQSRFASYVAPIC